MNSCLLYSLTTSQPESLLSEVLLLTQVSDYKLYTASTVHIRLIADYNMTLNSKNMSTWSLAKFDIPNMMKYATLLIGKTMMYKQTMNGWYHMHA